MTEHEGVSRKELFEVDDKPSELDGSLLLPDLEFEFVEVECCNASEKCLDSSIQDEFDFPLFSCSAVEWSATQLNNSCNAGTSVQITNGHEPESPTQTRLSKVSLREEESEVIKNERPMSYYIAEYTTKQKKRLQLVAIEYDLIMKEAAKDRDNISSKYRGKFVDLVDHNAKVEAELLRQLKLKRRRPSKRQRMAKRLGKLRESERQNKVDEIKKMIKKKFHKRGGKKNKKK
ncbi:uncharacterized protein Ecym_3299 [Eremothecium cymbalariae DBVPG|uniref:Uncharacterized protein n=1 Tax=Eremothecium cymbalariae (strain CBS 270.75 / DBVPG 7215 / KCTC 17166 / NRRL Y-17582) TaxID=931890 RepID=G8JRM2_ERECY|nr:Hypothetical protein Ecym_3299 [Eremothecium cymbalariae DBVPG\